jgi:hypothetical protein
MWGNYFGNYVCCMKCFDEAEHWKPKEDWYNPGFLLRVDNISDITTDEIFSCLTSSTYTFDKLKTQLKTKTSYDAQIDTEYSSYSDWP